MPTPNPSALREFKEAAVATTLTAPINSTAASFTIAANSGWPTGAAGNFIVTLDRGTTEERILCSAQSGGTVTVAASGRGFNGSTAQSHASGATAEHGGSAFDFGEFNAHGASATAVHGVATVAGLTEVQTLTNKTLNGATLDAASTLNGISGTTLAADRAAWTDFSGSVTLPGATLGNGSLYARYKQVGKTVHVDFRLTGGSTSTWGAGSATIRGLHPVTQASAGSANNDIKTGNRFTQSTNAAVLMIAQCLAATPTDHVIYVGGNTTPESGAFAGLVYGLRFTFEAA